MSLAGIRFWQWLLLSIVLGGAVGALWYFQDQDMDLNPNNRVTTDEFVQMATMRAMDGGPLLTNLKIHTPRKLATGKVAAVEFVWHDRVNAITHRRESIPAWTDTPVPLNAARGMNGLPATITQFLDQASRSNPGLSYKMALSDYIWYPFAKAMALSVAGFGIVIPIILSLLQSAGVMQKPERGPSLASIKQTKTVQAKATGPTRADMDDLATLNAKLEENVADMLMKHEDPDDAAERKAEQKLIRKLNNQPDVDEHLTAQQQEDKDFVGEFYPVARPHGHKEDEPKKPEVKK